MKIGGSVSGEFIYFDDCLEIVMDCAPENCCMKGDECWFVVAFESLLENDFCISG